jgi:hypothetical protein
VPFRDRLHADYMQACEHACVERARQREGGFRAPRIRNTREYETGARDVADGEQGLTTFQEERDFIL